MCENDAELDLHRYTGFCNFILDPHIFLVLCDFVTCVILK